MSCQMYLALNGINLTCVESWSFTWVQNPQGIETINKHELHNSAREMVY